MRKTIKKTLALLLTALMLFGTAIPMVSAEGTTETTYPSYEDAAPGEKLYDVDFKDKTVYNYSLLSGNATLTPSNDGRSLTMATTAGTCSFGGAIADMPMGEGAGIYTITFTLTVGGTYEPQYLYANSTKTDGFVVRQDVVGTSDNFSNGYTRNLHTNSFPYRPVDATNIEYKMVVDNSAKQIDLFMNANTASGVEYGWILVETRDYTSNDENLNLIFGSGKNQKDDRSITVSDICIYKGVADTIAVNRPGELLLELGDMSEAQTNTQNGVEYNPNINFLSSGSSLNYSYSDGGIHKLGGTRGAWGICQYGGTTNLRLGYGQKYTVTYSVKQNSAYVCGLAFSAYPETTGRTYSVTMDADSIFIGKNAQVIGDPNTVADTRYTDSAKTDGTVYCNDGYANVAVELDNYQITVYVNGAKQISWSTLPEAGDQKSHIGYTVQNLTLAFAEFMRSATTNVESDNFAQYKDVKVYSGLTVSNKYVTVVDGEKTELVPVPATEANYTLPAREAAAGYVFKGWVVDGEVDANGNPKVTAPDTPVSTTNLKRIEAVYVKAMSDVWVQFGNTDTENNTTDMRIVGVLDSLKYSSIGYDIVIKYTVAGQEQTYTSANYELHNVYNSLLAKYGTEVVTPETLGFGADSGYYLTAFTIFNVPTNIGEITFELTPYQIDLDGNKMPGETISLSFNQMWAKHTASEN